METSFSPGKVTISFGRETITHKHLSTKSTKNWLRFSLSNNNYSFTIITHSTQQQSSAAILAQVTMVVQDVLCQLVWVCASNNVVSGAVSGARDPNSTAQDLALWEFAYMEEDDLGTPSFPESYMEESFPLLPVPVPRFAFADLAAFFSAFLPRRLLSLRLDAGLARFLRSTSWPCSPCSQPSCTCAPAMCRAFSYDRLSCCDCMGCARDECCVIVIRDTTEGEYGVAVGGVLGLLFDVLAVVDTCASLLFAALVFACAWGSVLQEVQPSLRKGLRWTRPRCSYNMPFLFVCLCEGKVDLAVMAAKLGVSHNYLCDVVFEHGLKATVGELQAAARLWAAAYDSVATEDVAQAAAAPDNLLAKLGEEEKSKTKREGMRCS